MRAGVPEGLAALVVRELEELNLAVSLKWARRVMPFPAVALETIPVLCLESIVESVHFLALIANLRHNDLLRQLRRDHLGYVQWSGRKGSTQLLGSIRELDFNLLTRHLGDFLTLSGVELVEILIPLSYESRLLDELPLVAEDLDLLRAAHLVARRQLRPLAGVALVGAFDFLLLGAAAAHMLIVQVGPVSIDHCDSFLFNLIRNAAQRQLQYWCLI